jgi:hypothetical protein
MTAPDRTQANSATHTPTPWMWAWRDDEDAPASIYSMIRDGHAYAVAMCPKYQKREQWVADAKFIIEACNNYSALKARIAELESNEKAYEEIIGKKTFQEVADRIRELEARLEEARQLVAEANNSLYGSQGYFHSLTGGPFNKYHLAEGIENLKAAARAAPKDPTP